LELLRRLKEKEEGFDIEPTLLSAHAIPEEYVGRNAQYISEVVLPSIDVCSNHTLSRFCDAFLEEGAFGFRDSERILEYAQMKGLELKIHADEFSDQGGARLAAKMSCVSADHLGKASDEGIAALAHSAVVAVLLPGTLLSSFVGTYARGREMIRSGVPVAIATDLSPNSWIESMQFICSLACYGMKLTPEEALVGATINGAHAILRNSNVGSIEVGKYFDALIFDLNNYVQIPYMIGTNRVNKVLKQGKVVAEN